VVGQVCINAGFDGAGGDGQDAAPNRRLNGLEIEAVDRAAADQPLDFGEDLGVEVRFEALFLAAPSCGAASDGSDWCSMAHASEACQ
jgi:hypothetical protein